MGRVSQIRSDKLGVVSRETFRARADVVFRDMSSARRLAKAWAETLPLTERETFAGLFARRALRALAEKTVASPALYPTLIFQCGQLDEKAEALAIALGGLAAGLPLLSALHQVTSLYPALLPTKMRGERGAFYTPPVLVQHLLDRATEAGVDWRTARVFDPALGGGIFLFHAARRMIDALDDCEPVFALANIASRLVGFEIDAHAAVLAQGAFEIAVADIASSAGRAAPRIVETRDSLFASPSPIFDLVLGNPPYGRVSLSAEQRERYARSLYGHANLYGIFTDAALRWTKPSGIIAYLTPTSFLGGQYYAALRRLLAEEAPPVSIDFVQGRRGVFEDVLQETLLAVYKRSGKPRRARIHYLNVGSEDEAEVVRNGTVGVPIDHAAPWLAPRIPRHGPLVARAESMRHRFADWGYEVSTGPLVWNRYKGQLRNGESGPGIHPLIWAESITPDGRFVFRAQKKNHAPFFKIEAKDGWLLVSQPCVLVQRTTAKEQARRLIAAELPIDFISQHQGVIVENHLNMVRAKGLARVSAATIAALLNSRIVDDLFRCISGSVAVSAFELEALPLPSPDDVSTLAKLVDADAPRARIETECARLYGAF